MSASLERALADLVGGYDGGWALWRAALSSLELAVERRREGYDAFRSYPPGELRKLLVDVDDALRMATLAVDVQVTLDHDEPAQSPADRRRDVAELLLARARGLVEERRA